MSLIVLNSKGSDPEDFSNFMTEQIKFPSDAEVCLVSSHINRKMMVDDEVRLEAGGNTLGFQFGTGTLDILRATTGYTPHSPSAWEIGEADNHFPIITKDNETALLANAFMNKPDYQPISPLVGGWTSSVPIANSLFTFVNTLKVPDAPSSLGNTRVEDILIQPGYNQITEGGVNNTSTLPGNASVVDASIAGGALYDGWVACAGEDTACFVDNDPVWNTDTGARITQFNQPASTAASLAGGAWTWGFAIAGADEKDITGLRGGIFSNAQFSGQTAQNQSSNLSKITGGTDYSIWWEITSADLIAGSIRVKFYARNPKPSGSKGKQDDDRIEWGSANIPGSALTNGIRLGFRPVQRPIGGQNRYVIEGFYGRADNATNAWVGATRPVGSAPGVGGYIEVTDPETPAIIPALQFNLYRHLPLRMGCNTQSSTNPVLMNAPHHARTTHIDMPAPGIATSPDFTFCLGNITPTDQSVYQFDGPVRQILRKATIGSTLGFVDKFKKISATDMALPAGFPAEVTLGLVQPIAKPLVVVLPDLPISGFYGNSAGELSAGTLNMNSGGSSSAILGVIPYGDKPFKDPTGLPHDDPEAHRGEFFSSPMENWIQLSNPAPFSLSSIRCKITDALGQKPDVLDTNTTITIKIKARRSSRDSMRQGGLASNFRNQ